MLEECAGQCAIAIIAPGSTRVRASPGTAIQGVAHAACVTFFSEAGFPSPSQPLMDDAIGAACAAASQKGPKRVSSSTANTDRAIVRSKPEKGRKPFVTPAICIFSAPKSTDA
jgi:hypothetical protein